jgi:hypothetical protein
MTLTNLALHAIQHSVDGLHIAVGRRPGNYLECDQMSERGSLSVDLQKNLGQIAPHCFRDGFLELLEDMRCDGRLLGAPTGVSGLAGFELMASEVAHIALVSVAVLSEGGIVLAQASSGVWFRSLPQRSRALLMHSANPGSPPSFISTAWAGLP